MEGMATSKRFVVVLGKGGVGRSTVASALGLLGAQAGLRTVIAEFSTTSSLPGVFGVKGGGYDPVKLADNLYTVAVRPEPALHEYALRKVRFEAIYKLVFENPPIRKLLAAVPGFTELLVLGKAFDLEREGAASGPTWDRVIVDAPATGHGISLFRLPQVLLELVQTGPLADEARAMRDLLWDEGRTLVHLVSLAEELPVEETIGLAKATRESLKMPLGALFINRVWPPLASDGVRTQVEDFRSQAEGDQGLAIKCFDQLEARRRAQEPHLARLREALDLPTVTLPELFGGATGVDALSQIGQMMETALGPTAKEAT